MKRFLSLFICALLLCGLVLTAASCKKEVAPASPVNGTMRLVSTPSDATISILGKDIGKTPYTTNPVPQGMYIVKIQKPGCKPYWKPVKVVPGKETLVDAELQPLTSTVVIDTIPSGGFVTMNGKDYSNAPVVIGDLPIGTYKATVKLSGYAQKEVTWEIPNDRPVMIKVPLTNNVGTLNVRSDPEGASVTIDGQSFGNTPLNETLEQGQYKLVLSKEGYKSFEKIVSVLREETTREEVTLDTLPGSMNITSDPLGAAIFINGVEFGVTPYTRASIESGSYQVKLSKEGFDDEESEITIQPGSHFEKEFSLHPNTGTINLTISPAGMNVYLDGKFICKTEPENDDEDVCKQISLSNLSYGKHTVTITHKKADPQKKEMTVTLGKGQTLQAPRISFWLPNAQLVLTNGSIYTGRIVGRYTQDSTKLLFRHSAGIQSEYQRSQIREINKLKIDE